MTIRILHVVGGMNRGGVETWLMHVLRNINRKRFRMDFLVHTSVRCSYDEEILSLGSRIIPCPHPHRPWLYAKNFKRIMTEYGPFDVVHSHVHHFSGYVLRIAHRAHVPITIAHSHNDTLNKQVKADFLRRIYLTLMRRWIWRYATMGLAASQKAAISLFSSSLKTNVCWSVLYCGIDLAPFNSGIDRHAVLSKLGIPDDSFVVGHIGRFVPQKNHDFFLDVAVEILRRKPQSWFLFVGDGQLRPAILEKAKQLGILKRAIFTGTRDDVPQIMKGAIDAFLFPSRYEGLGLVLIEAQAAGIPCVVSDVVPEEADVVPGLIARLRLDQSIEVWAETVLRTASKHRVTSEAALETVAQSPFNIQRSIESLLKLYDA
jgi:glycosyltransferase involved in cell wall biosynthesis